MHRLSTPPGLPRPLRRRGAIIGVIHLGPLPGSPGHLAPLVDVIESATSDARHLADGGVDGVIVENFGDSPFFPGSVPPITIAAMTRASLAVAEALALCPREIALGINVLRNDAQAALAIAGAVQGDFIRVNVHTGAMVTDQGTIEGMAYQTVRERRALGLSGVAILADILVKHASPLAPTSLEDSAHDTHSRGWVDGLILSGRGTGKATDPGRLTRAQGAAPNAPLFVGSGATLESLPYLFEAGAHGIIVGTALKEGGKVDNPVDPARVRAFIARAKELTS